MPPACEKIQRMSRNFCALPLKNDVGDGAGGVGAEFDHDRRLGADQVDAAIGRRRMGVDHHLAAVEFFHDRQKQRIAEPFVAIARQQADAVELERVERVFDFLQAALGVGQRQHREASEPAGMVGDQLGGVFVALARHFARRLAGGVIDARRRYREHRDRHAGGIHIRQRIFRPPFPHQGFAEIIGDRSRDIARRRQMMVNVDAIGFCLGGFAPASCGAADPGRREGRGSRDALHEIAPAQRRAGQRKRVFASAGTAPKRPAGFSFYVFAFWVPFLPWVFHHVTFASHYFLLPFLSVRSWTFLDQRIRVTV